MSVIRIAFLGTPEFARYHLAQLLSDDHFEVVGVVTQPDRPSGRNMRLTPSPVRALAEGRHIPVITPESMKTDDAIAQVAAWKAEAAVVVAYGQILPQKFLDLFPNKVVNVHASLLPRWRGAAPIQRALEAGDKITGVSLQVMVRKLDAGAVIGSYPLDISDNMNAAELHDALQPLGAKLLAVDFMDYLRGHLTPVPQDETQVTYAHKIEKSEARMNWNAPAAKVHNHVRGMAMGPGSMTEIDGKKLKILKTERLENSFGLVPGEVVDVEKDSFSVHCAQGAIKVLEVQPESRAKMPVREYLLGHSLQKGQRFT